MINRRSHGCMINMYINRHDGQAHKEILYTGRHAMGHGTHKNIETRNTLSQTGDKKNILL